MISQQQRKKELIESGLVDAIRQQYANTQSNIPDEYYVMLADYVDSISQVQDSLYLNAMDVARELPHKLAHIIEANLDGICGRTDKNTITMNANLDYETKKLYFFHKLTRALQTREVNGHEECSFYDGNNGMFLAEGAIQYTAEILYHVSNGTNINIHQQQNTVRGHRNHTTYSPLSAYQLNGNILMLLSKSMGLPINQVLALGYRKDGREKLKNLYESFPGNENKFDKLMMDMEKVSSIDKLIIAGLGDQLQGAPVNIIMPNGQQFWGNLQSQEADIIKIERELAANFIANNDSSYILQNYQNFAQYLTTPELQQNFLNAVRQIGDMEMNID